MNEVVNEWVAKAEGDFRTTKRECGYATSEHK
jgi:hypothetical protein